MKLRPDLSEGNLKEFSSLRKPVLPFPFHSSLLRRSDQTVFVTQSQSSLLPTYTSPHLWNQLPISLRISHPNYSPPFQRPSFEHAGLTCCTLLSPSITFYSFTLSSKPTFSENLILHLSLFLSVGLALWL